jgi:hypothetical protein
MDPTHTAQTAGAGSDLASLIREQLLAMKEVFETALEAQQREYQRQQAENQAAIATLRLEIEALRLHSVTPAPAPQTTPTPRTAPPESTSKRSDRLPDPPPFTGKPKELPSFLAKLRYKLEGNTDRYPTPRSQFLYTLSRLEGDASTLVEPLMDVEIHSVEQLLCFLQTTYGDPNRKATALAKLDRLKQGNRSFISHFAEFRRLATDSGINETGLIMQLKRSLSDNLQHAMVGAEQPDTLTGYANLIAKYDNDLRYLKISKPTRSVPHRPDPNMMDIDSVDGYAPVGSAERQKRIKEGRCFKCGKKGHISPDCSVPIPRTRIHASSLSPKRGRSRTTRSSRSTATSRSVHHSSEKSSRLNHRSKDRSQD